MTVSKGFSGNMASVKASQRRAVAQQVLGRIPLPCNKTAFTQHGELLSPTPAYAVTSVAREK
jgi:hypothetical protein